MYSKFHFKVSSWGSNCIFPQKSWYTGWLGSPERLVNTEHFETPHVFNKTILACIPIVNQDVPGQKGPGGQAGNLTTQYSKATSQGARGRTKELRGERDAGGTQTTPTGGRQSMKGDSGKNGWIPTLSVSSLPGTTHSPHRPIPNSAHRGPRVEADQADKPPGICAQLHGHSWFRHIKGMFARHGRDFVNVIN